MFATSAHSFDIDIDERLIFLQYYKLLGLSSMTHRTPVIGLFQRHLFLVINARLALVSILFRGIKNGTGDMFHFACMESSSKVGIGLCGVICGRQIVPASESNVSGM